MGMEKQEKGQEQTESDSRSKNLRGKQWVAEQLRNRYGQGENAWRVWNPVPNTTSELLVTSADCRKTVLLHIRYSRTYPKDFGCVTSGWHDVEREDLEKTKADFWVFVTKPIQKAGHAPSSDCDFVIIKPSDLRARLEKTSSGSSLFRLYLTNIGGTLVDTRDIDALGDGQTKGDIPSLVQKAMHDQTSPRNYTPHLNNWPLLEAAMLK